MQDEYMKNKVHMNVSLNLNSQIVHSHLLHNSVKLFKL